MRGQVDPIECEARAVESGAHAFSNDDGTFTVRSFSRADVKHTVRPGVVERGNRYVIHLACTCESGTVRRSELIACQHGALVGRRLERMGWASWEAGIWFATDVALRAVGIGRKPAPIAQILKGACPICRQFLTVKIHTGEKRLPAELAAEHRQSCAVEYARRLVAYEAAERPTEVDGSPIDLWDRGPQL